MAVLVDHKIREAIKRGWIKVDPFDDSLINPNSLDIRLGGNFSTVEPKIHFHNAPGVVNPLDKDTFITKEYKGDKFELNPGCMVLASLLENVELADFICAKIVGKSSLGRLGLDNSSCAGWVDSGWQGVLTIELFNHSRNSILLTKGMKIGQMVFFENEPAEKPYGMVGRYQNQKPGQGSHGV